MLTIQLKSDGRILKVKAIKAHTPSQMKNSAIQPKTVWEYEEIDNPKNLHVLTENDYEIIECIPEY